MSSETVMPKEQLAAFADGELSPEEAAAVVMHLVDHPGDQAYVDALMAANEALGTAFDAPMQEPVPEAIRAAIFSDAQPHASTEAEIIPFRRKPMAWAASGLALAASLTLAALLVPNLLQPRDPGDLLEIGPVAQGSDLSRTLETLPSGTINNFGEGVEVMVLATLPTTSGFCREIEVIHESKAVIELGIACRAQNGWQVETTLSEPLSATGSPDGFVTASGTEAATLQPALDRLGAGPALDAAREAELLAQGWAE